MPHRPSNSELAAPLPASRCMNCLWNEAADPNCVHCHSPAFDTMAEAIEYIRRGQGWPKAELVYAYSPAQQARQMEDEAHIEADKVKPDAVIAGSAPEELPLSESIYLQESATRALREYLRVQRDKEQQEWETRAYASTMMLANPRWIIPPPAASMPEPAQLVIVDRITGERYTTPRFTDNGVIAFSGGEEYFLPCGSYETELQS